MIPYPKPSLGQLLQHLLLHQSQKTQLRMKILNLVVISERNVSYGPFKVYFSIQP